ncbi:MAG: ferritin-like domain-containing protein [Endomicrobia bacterium]|nr:ferritin-like domain-containing protein [Endomicrobiia bacterium]
MDKYKLIEKLQEMLNYEYTDVFIYNNEAELLENKIKNGAKLKSLYKNFALDELTHAEIISKKILDLKEKPIWEYKNFLVSKSVRESLKFHIEREIKAIRSYQELIENITDREFKIKLKGIKNDEEEHLKQITDFLNNLR